MDSVLSFLGIARRAGKILYGEKLYEHMKDVKLVFIASDASEKTKERILKKCSYYEIPWIADYGFKEISEAIGRHNVKIAGIADEGMARSVLSKRK